VKDARCNCSLLSPEPWTSVVLPRRTLWRPRDALPLLPIIVQPMLPLLLPLHLLPLPSPSPLSRARLIPLHDHHSNLPQSLQACPSTGKRHGACAIRHTRLLVPGVEVYGIATSAPRMGRVHQQSVLCASRAFMKSTHALVLYSWTSS
jgi:hypothetical protein